MEVWRRRTSVTLLWQRRRHHHWMVTKAKWKHLSKMKQKTVTVFPEVCSWTNFECEIPNTKLLQMDRFIPFCDLDDITIYCGSGNSSVVARYRCSKPELHSLLQCTWSTHSINIWQLLQSRAGEILLWNKLQSMILQGFAIFLCRNYCLRDDVRSLGNIFVNNR